MMIALVISAITPLSAGDSPTLPELQHFPVNGGFKDLVDEIGNDYEKFGILLLNDDNGIRVKGIEKTKNGDLIGITVEILRQWLQGKGRKPVTWRTLVKCLKDTNLHAPAGIIEAALNRSDIPDSTGSTQPASSKCLISATL